MVFLARRGSAPSFFLRRPRSGPAGTAHRRPGGDIALQPTQILLYLHGRRPPIIHRDIKPQNVILGPGGLMSLIDFGISRTYRAGAAEDTASFGTRRFAPPEQYGFQQTDGRWNLYSLGAVMCYLITGDVHSQAETAAAFRP